MPVHLEAINNIILEEKQSKGIVLIDHLYKNVVQESNHLYLLENGKVNPLTGESDLSRFGYIS